MLSEPRVIAKDEILKQSTFLGLPRRCRSSQWQ